MKQWIIIGYLSFASGAATAQDVYQQVKQAHDQYEAGDYAAALKTLGPTLNLATNDTALASTISYNLANALYKSQQFDSALVNYAKAESSPDLTTQQRAAYNQGNVLYQLAQQQANPPEVTSSSEEPIPDQALKTAIEHLSGSLGRFEDAIRLDREDSDAKVNYELAHNQREALIREQQKREQEKQEKEEQEKEDPEEEEKEDPENSDPEQPEGEEDPEQQPPDQEDPENKDPESKENESPENPEPSDPKENESPPDPTPGKNGKEMTQEEAEMLLDQMKTEEEGERRKNKIIMGKKQRVLKDW